MQDTAGTPTVFWQANSQNAAGQVTGETLGNGLTASRTYDAFFRLTAVSATSGSTTPHSQTFSYDPIGNVIGRSDVTQSVTESFAYDDLNRLTSISGSGLTTRSFDYNAIGNLTGASGTLYPATGSVSFSRTLTYASFNLPTALSHTQGSATYNYTYRRARRARGRACGA